MSTIQNMVNFVKQIDTTKAIEYIKDNQKLLHDIDNIEVDKSNNIFDVLLRMDEKTLGNDMTIGYEKSR